MNVAFPISIGLHAVRNFLMKKRNAISLGLDVFGDGLDCYRVQITHEKYLIFVTKKERGGP